MHFQTMLFSLQKILWSQPAQMVLPVNKHILKTNKQNKQTNLMDEAVMAPASKNGVARPQSMLLLPQASMGSPTYKYPEPPTPYHWISLIVLPSWSFDFCRSSILCCSSLIHDLHPSPILQSLYLCWGKRDEGYNARFHPLVTQKRASQSFGNCTKKLRKIDVKKVMLLQWPTHRDKCNTIMWIWYFSWNYIWPSIYPNI